jgi:uncharacterized protein (TIGR02421 family)
VPLPRFHLCHYHRFSLVVIWLVFFHLAPIVGGWAWPAPTAADRHIDDLLASFSRALEFSTRINPTADSQDREKARFLAAVTAGESYEPVFDYEPLGPRSEEVAAELVAAPAGSSAFGPLLATAHTELLVKWEVLRARGTEAFADLSARLYRPPDLSLLRAAHHLLRTEPVPTEPLTVESGELAERLRVALREYDLGHWSVVLSRRMGARAAVLPQARTIKVREDTRFSEDDVVRLIHHEIGVHAVRAEAGHRAPLRVFTVGLADYLETEEGMAVTNEVRHGVRSGLRLFALRVLAVHWARAASFSQVFHRLRRREVDPETAWSITMRVKRGLIDTSRPGAYTKDAAYLRGFLLINRFLEQGGSWSDLMRFGKVGLDALPMLKKLDPDGTVTSRQPRAFPPPRRGEVTHKRQDGAFSAAGPTSCRSAPLRCTKQPLGAAIRGGKGALPTSCRVGPLKSNAR